jgi:putative drug exporter of the RND superfamily
MCQSYDRTDDTRAAVIEGIGRTGRLVTSAALILVLSFLAMSSAPQTDIKILATGLGAGILVDATLIRCLLVPAFVSLFGAYNWWLPTWAARLLRVTPSPLHATERPRTTVASILHHIRTGCGARSLASDILRRTGYRTSRDRQERTT